MAKEKNKIDKIWEGLKDERAKKFIFDKLLFYWIKSFLPFSHIKSLNDVSQDTIDHFSMLLNKEIKKEGIKNVGSQIRNALWYREIEFEEEETRVEYLLSLYVIEELNGQL